MFRRIRVVKSYGIYCVLSATCNTLAHNQHDKTYYRAQDARRATSHTCPGHRCLRSAATRDCSRRSRKQHRRRPWSGRRQKVRVGHDAEGTHWLSPTVRHPCTIAPSYLQRFTLSFHRHQSSLTHRHILRCRRARKQRQAQLRRLSAMASLARRRL